MLYRHAIVVLAMQAFGGLAVAGASPVGTWIDHTGQGAVEITKCNDRLCGRIVWLKSAENLATCDVQVIGNVKSAPAGKWGGGWIYDPDTKSKYDVELTPMGDSKLKVLGYVGIKTFGETMTWTRAPANLQRCATQQVPIETAQVLPPDARALPAAPAGPVDRTAPPAATETNRTETAQSQPPSTVASATARPTAGAQATTAIPVPAALPTTPTLETAALQPVGRARTVGKSSSSVRTAQSRKYADKAAPAPSKRRETRTTRSAGQQYGPDAYGVAVYRLKRGCQMTVASVGSFRFPC